MSFIKLAQDAQKELDGELLRLKQKDAKLDEKSSVLESKMATAEQKEAELSLKEKELQKREEEVARREMAVRRDSELQADLQAAIEERKTADKALKAAKEHEMDATLKLEDLSRREINLSEREKTYKEEIKKQVASKMLGI